MKRVSGILMAVVLCIAGLTLAGWAFDLEFLKRPWEGNEYMYPITAFSMVIACSSFFIQYRLPQTAATIITGKLLAFAVLVVALAKLFALTGLNSGVDHWLFKEKIIAEGEKPMRADWLTVINSAFGFFITGVALLLAGLRNRYAGVVVVFLGLAGFIVGTFVCIGFIYHINEFFGILPYMSVAPATAVCFVLFSLGILFENSDAAFMAVFSSNLLGGKIARQLLWFCIGIPLLFGYLGLMLSWWFPFSAALGTALLSVSIVVVFLVVLWFLARALNGLDTERAAALLQLERQAQLFNIIPDAVLFGNRDYTITNINPAAVEVFGVRQDELGGLKVDDLFNFEPIGVSSQTVRREVWGDKGFWRGESLITTRNGKAITAMVLLKAVTDGLGNKAGWVGVYTDISFLRVNEELQAANNYLEQLAFISAHDIKSPIVTLNGLADLMSESAKISEADLKVLQMMKNVIRQMQATNKALNEILMLRQKLKVKSTVESDMISLEGLLSNIRHTLDTELKLAGAELKTDITGAAGLRLPQVYFQSMFFNLASNSLRYRDPGRALVISIQARLMDEDTISFTVEDNGLGFDIAHNRKRLFGIFKRFHNHVEGTGIGLHIVKSIADAFNGNIDVYSKQGEGTRFEIQFKLTSLV